MSRDQKKDLHATMTAPDPALITAAISALRDTLSEVYTEKMVNTYINAALPTLSTYSASTLERIIRYPWTDQSAQKVTSKMDSSEWTETTINDYIAVSEVLVHPDQHGIHQYGINSSHGNVWHRYTDLHPFNNDGDYPDERRSQLTALYRVVEHLQTNDKNRASKYLADDKLRQFVLHPDAPYEREDIVDIITTHTAHDVARIKSILDHSSPALRSGVL